MSDTYDPDTLPDEDVPQDDPQLNKGEEAELTATPPGTPPEAVGHLASSEPAPGLEGQPYNPNIRGEPKPEDAWQLYAVQAIQGLYPHMRAGRDFAWGKPPDDPEGQPKMLHWDERYAPADEGKIKEAAQKLADADPYLIYKPKPPLHQGTVPPPGEPPPQSEPL